MSVVELLFSAASRHDSQPAVIEFLTHLRRHLPGNLLICLGPFALPPQPPRVGICAPAARAPVAGVPSGVRAGAESSGVSVGSLEAARVTKLLSRQLRELSYHARRALRRMRRRPKLVCAFWERADLFPL